jgi:polyisoprenyl-phosphate glycosyltransferase
MYHPPEISVIVPVHNEVGNLVRLAQQVGDVLTPLVRDWELIFIDDGSQDGSWQQICSLHKEDDHIRGLSFSRNFGKEIAIAAGLDEARGKAVILMDADLQHPPEILARFIEKWREGYVMVYAQRDSRADETRIRRGFARAFYRIFDRYGEMRLPEGAGDFRLIDRKGVEVLRSLSERARFSKGLYAWIGFRSIGVPYHVHARASGTSSWSLRKLFRFAFDGITSFSTVPLRVWTYLGLLISILSLATALYFALHTLFYGSDVPGFPSLIVSVMFFSGIQLMSLGIIGEYIGRIFAEVKKRPLYVVAERVGGV